MNILMLGNSFTYYHDMPEILKRISGQNVVSITKGGAYLSEQLDPDSEIGARTKKALSEEKWDYVVLQEQSVGPALKKGSYLESVSGLCEMIRENGARPVIYATWAYKDDTDKLRSVNLGHREMLDLLTAGCHEAAEKNGALIADVGLRFGSLEDMLELYMPDAFHPSEAGSVLAAETIWQVIREDSRAR